MPQSSDHTLLEVSEETAIPPVLLSAEGQDKVRGLAYLAIRPLVECGILTLRSELSYSNVDDEHDLPRVEVPLFGGNASCEPLVVRSDYGPYEDSEILPFSGDRKDPPFLTNCSDMKEIIFPVFCERFVISKRLDSRMTKSIAHGVDADLSLSFFDLISSIFDTPGDVSRILQSWTGELDLTRLEKVEAVYFSTLFLCTVICRADCVLDYRSYDVQRMKLLMAFENTCSLIEDLPKRLSLLLEHCIQREKVFNSLGFRLLSYRETEPRSKGKAGWRLVKRTNVPFGMTHIACHAAKRKKRRDVSGRTATKARVFVEFISILILTMLNPIFAALQVLYVFLLSAGSWWRARERWISASRSFEDWMEESVLIGSTKKFSAHFFGSGASLSRWLPGKTKEQTRDTNVDRCLDDIRKDEEWPFDDEQKSFLCDYTDQGVVIYYSLKDENQLMRLYTPNCLKTHLIGPAAKDAMNRVSKIRYHPDGGLVSSSATSLLAAWLYISFTLFLSVLASVQNWGGRDNALERVSDGIWIATSLLISVFGLLKLTSENPNAIRHAITGKKVLQSSEDVYDYLSLPLLHPDVSQDQILKGVLSMYPGVLSWLGTNETCFTQAEPSGNMRIDGGLDESVAVGFGLLRARNGVLYVGSTRRYAYTAQNNLRWHITRQDVNFRIEDIITAKGIYTEYEGLEFTYGDSGETLMKRRIGRQNVSCG